MFTRALDTLNRRGASLAARVRGVHPKHLLREPWHHWYLEYLQRDDDVLDLGCGTGLHAKAVRKHGVRSITAVDQGAVDLNYPLPFLTESYSAVMLLDVLEHLHRQPRLNLLKEIHRVLVAHGVLLVSVPNRETTWRRELRDAGLFSFSDADHKTEYTKTTLYSELKAGGFDMGAVMPVVYDTRYAGMIDLIGAVSIPVYRKLMAWKRRAVLREPKESIGFRVVCLKSSVWSNRDYSP